MLWRIVVSIIIVISITIPVIVISMATMWMWMKVWFFIVIEDSWAPWTIRKFTFSGGAAIFDFNGKILFSSFTQQSC
jgi:hypothetical protein